MQIRVPSPAVVAADRRSITAGPGRTAMVEDYLNAIDYAIIALYLAVQVVLGLHLKRRTSASLEECLLGNRSMPWWMLGQSAVLAYQDLCVTRRLSKRLVISALALRVAGPGKRGGGHRGKSRPWD